MNLISLAIMSWRPTNIESLKTNAKIQTPKDSCSIVSLYCEKTLEKFKDCIIQQRKGIYIRLHKKACGCEVIVKEVPQFSEMVIVKK